MEEFYCKTRILSGPGSISQLGQLGIRRLLLVSDPYFHKNGWTEKITRLVGAEHTDVFTKILPDPTVELAAEGTNAVLKSDPDTIIALGGGSAMDCAKAMAYFSGKNPRLVAIPTTSGSGSEVTDFAILTHGGTKHPLVDGAICPDVAILDSELLTQLPKSLIADSGFDVLSHALEAYVATNAGDMTDALASGAFSAVLQKLYASYAGDNSVRQDVHNAATMAGIAFTRAGLGLCHALSHSLGGQFHVPHGRLNAILLPAVMDCNSAAAGAKYARIARQAGISGSVETLAVRNLKNALIRLRRELQMPETLKEAGVDLQALREKTEQIIAAALADPCCATNPIKPTEGIVRRILDEVSGRG